MLFSITFIISLIISLVLFGYFIPTIIALLRKKKNALPIFILNLLLGITFIGWVTALVWSLMYEEKDNNT